MYKLLSSFLIGCALVFTGCTPNAPLAVVDYTVPMTPAQTKTDGRILGSLVVLNQNEIAAGQEAVQRSTNPAVKNFADMMIRDHGANLARTEEVSQKSGIATINGPIAMTLKQKGRRLMYTLKHVNNASFDKVYINAMVKGHAEALNLIDKLIPLATNPAVKAHLQDTRTHVAHHLAAAQQIQATL